jgi:hypothetical protein
MTQLLSWRLPEVWIPYGSVETLVTIQAENLGELIEPRADEAQVQVQQLDELSGTSLVFIGDTKPTTLELVRSLLGRDGSSALRFCTRDTKRVESSLPELKGRLLEPSQDTVKTAGGFSISSSIFAAGSKLVIATAQPDPLFGIVDARVRCALDFVNGAWEGAAAARKDYEPTPFERTESYDLLDGAVRDVADIRFVTIVPRGGRAGAVLVDPSFDDVRGSFYSCGVSQSKAMVVGVGGAGYDDTLSGALRTVWSVLEGVRKSGELLVVAECSRGLGSRALELLVTGRLGEEGRGRGKYVEGLEEVFYLNKLKQEYDVMLLSGLPEVYAKTKLGFSTAKGSAEALAKLLTKLGRTSKVNVVTRACECKVRSA